MTEINSTVIKQIIEMFPDCLGDREKQVIKMRYGLDDGIKQTLQQIGDRYGVCRERVRQIEKKALRKLKHPARIKKLNMIELTEK